VSRTNHLAPRYAFSSIPPLPRPSYVKIFSSTPYSQTPLASFPPLMSATMFHTIIVKIKCIYCALLVKIKIIYKMHGTYVKLNMLLLFV
jgi:hypothetical protein